MRGAVASRTISDGTTQETTSYEYDPAGQLIKETEADGSWFVYAYDTAHRLIAVSDNLGNSIKYTLDLTGNRISEQVNDANGNVARQIARTFNAVNQMTQVTGSAQ